MGATHNNGEEALGDLVSSPSPTLVGSEDETMDELGIVDYVAL